MVSKRRILSVLIDTHYILALQEERKRKKEEEEHKKQRDRVAKMAEFEKWKNPPKANFVISKRLAAASGDDVRNVS